MAVFSQYEIYKYIKNNTNTTVLLNGQGADEIFTGYTNFYYVYLLELLKTFELKLFFKEFVALKNNRELSTKNICIQLLRTFVNSFFTRSDKYKLFNKTFDFIKYKNKFNDLLKNSLYQNLTFSSLREYLRYEDKNSMRFSLESRLPFLDYRLVQSVFALKNEDKIKNGFSKFTLRKIAKDKIPDKTLNRKDKMGFVSPQEVWQKTILKDELDKAFKDIEKNGLFDFINKKNIIELYENYKNNRLNDWAVIWNIYVVYKWKKIWKIKE